VVLFPTNNNNTGGFRMGTLGRTTTLTAALGVAAILSGCALPTLPLGAQAGGGVQCGARPVRPASWLGHQERELVARFGVPNSAVRMWDGNRALTWQSRWGALRAAGMPQHLHH
jgi:hypothetical protein